MNLFDASGAGRTQIVGPIHAGPLYQSIGAASGNAGTLVENQNLDSMAA